MNASRRRVLFIIPTLGGGGAERVIVTLLNHLDRKQFELTLAVVDTRRAAFLDKIPPDVQLIDLGCRRVLHALPKLVRLIWRMRPDSVLSTLGHLNLALAALRPLLPHGTRYLARETTVPSFGLMEYKHPSWWAWAYRRFYHRFDCVICQSTAMRDDLVAHFNVPMGITTVIHNPLDLENIAAAASRPLPKTVQTLARGLPPPAPISLITAGRLVAQKGIDVAIRALALTKNRRMNLTILGEGPERARLQALVADLGLESRVCFAGFQANPFAFYARADLFVLSSQYEGFPNVVLEALACGTPVVALPAPGGLSEIVGPIAGCILAYDMTAPALAAAFDRWTPTDIPRDAVQRYALPKIVALYADELTLSNRSARGYGR